MNKFWGLIIDDTKKAIEIIGTLNDDTLLTNNVVEMQRAGMSVRCQTPPTSIAKEDIKISGYSFEENLYSRLLLQYELKTRKSLRRW